MTQHLDDNCIFYGPLFLDEQRGLVEMEIHDGIKVLAWAYGTGKGALNAYLPVECGIRPKALVLVECNQSDQRLVQCPPTPTGVNLLCPECPPKDPTKCTITTGLPANLKLEHENPKASRHFMVFTMM